jgi:DNA-binding NtrC family response regulator
MSVQAMELLIVDDETHVVRAAARELKGRRFITADHASQALELLEQGQVKAVLTDYQLGQDDGVALLREIRRRWPEVRRGLMSARDQDPRIADWVNEGLIERFVAKPFARPLAEELGQLLATAQCLSVEDGETDDV